MKKAISILLIILFVANNVHAQTTEILRNYTIIKMVKAKLSDDLIIDEINNSKVNFNLSSDSVKVLTNANVSANVIQVMREVSAKQLVIPPLETKPQAPVVKTDTLQKTAKEQVKTKELSSDLSKNKKEIVNTKPIDKATLDINAVSYVTPIGELTNFFDSRYNSLVIVIQQWDKKVKDSTEKSDHIKEIILEVEKELTDKKNANSQAYTSDIELLKQKLSMNRDRYKQLKSNMLIDGNNWATKIKAIAEDMNISLNIVFTDVSHTIKKFSPDPSQAQAKKITVTKQKFNVDIIDHVAPATEMLTFYQNEIGLLQEIIVKWNKKALEIIEKDSELNKQLEPLNKKLEEYKSNKKQYKNEITELKKQCSDLEDQREKLSNQMEDDSKALAAAIKQMGEEVQSSMKIRFNDTIENINCSYEY